MAGRVQGQICTVNSAERVVSTTAEASALALSLNSSTGAQDLCVVWEGYVLVSETLTVRQGSTLNITGSDYAVLDGGGAIRLFNIGEAATLNLAHLRLEGGSVTATGESGGAILAKEGSRTTANNCTFSGHDATTGGGEWPRSTCMMEVECQRSSALLGPASLLTLSMWQPLHYRETAKKNDRNVLDLPIHHYSGAWPQ